MSGFNIDQSFQSWQIYTNIQGLDELRQIAKHDQKRALKEAARQFEALFLEMVFKQARKVNFDDEGLMTSRRVAFFQEWRDKQLAQDIAAKGSLGLADQLVRQLTPRYPVVTAEEYEKSVRQMKAAGDAAKPPLETTERVLKRRLR